MSTNTEAKDVRLVVRIENSQPIELLDLTKSLVSLASQFDKFTSKFGTDKESREAKLYVKEIKTGSVIIELQELATLGLIPFAENINTILDFTHYLQKATRYVLSGKNQKPELSPTDYRELSAIINPVAKDSGSQINVSTTINGNVEFNFHLNSNDSNALQNIYKNEIEKGRSPETINDIHEKVAMTLWQARTDLKSKVGNKGIVEEISNKPMNITFETDSIKEEMLLGNMNPFKSVFIVDLKIQTVHGQPAVYKILKFHESFEIEE
jgi:hypothetical protein